ncbi:uncharacterized protein [Panulirus ornatus]|uniref:uncharacterized protein n=1 Tax=Panulirus ornatus TaxID=150431 RepID=UPI003A8AE7D6
MDPAGSSVEDLERTVRELQCIDDAFGNVWSGGDPGDSMGSSPLDDRVDHLLTEMESRLYHTNMRLRLLEGLLPLRIPEDEVGESASVALRAVLATTPAAPLDRSDLTQDELGSEIARASGLLARLRVEAAKADETLAVLRNASATILVVKGTLAGLLDLLDGTTGVVPQAESLWGVDISHGTYCGDVVKSGLVSQLVTELLRDVVVAANALKEATQATDILAANGALICRMEGASGFLASVISLVTAEQRQEARREMTATLEALLEVEHAVAAFLQQEEEGGASIADSLGRARQHIHQLQTDYEAFGSSVVNALAAAYRKKKTVVKVRSEIPLKDPCCD